MEVDHGGLDTGMPQVFLDNPQVDARFQEMRGIGMPKGMHGDAALLDVGGELGLPKGALHTIDGHRVLGVPVQTGSQTGSEGREGRNGKRGRATITC